MSHIIIGTAGHVDHGKTRLIKALTGEDTDRLREEKERGISIDLGFAPFALPGGRQAGVVDVPGHERFINNMLAGIGGIDLVLLVVDVVEGVMPQTREHLAILELLKIKKGIVVLTKIDLAEEEWIDLVEEEVSEELAATFLAKAPVQRVSVVTGEGIEELKRLIDEMTAVIPPRDEKAPLRMPVDRVFSIAGFGTVLTGTILAGCVQVGDEVEVLPASEKVRARQIEVHGTVVEQAVAGQRVALNLAHLEQGGVGRGSVVGAPGYFHETSLLDARLFLLPTAPRPVKNLTPFHFYLGTGRVVARVVLLDTKELKPGGEALVQFRLEKPLVAHYQDRFILRSYSPVTTVGGGLVIDHLPARHKRFQTEIIKKLAFLEKGDPAEYVRQQLQQKPLQTVAELSTLLRLSPEHLKDILTDLVQKEELVSLEGFYIHREKVITWRDKTIERLSEYHQQKNLSPGLSRTYLKSFLEQDFPSRAYDYFLADLKEKKLVKMTGDIVSLQEFEPLPSAQEKKILTSLEDIYRQSGFSPPTFKEIAGKLQEMQVSKSLVLAKQKSNQLDVDSLVSYLLTAGVLIKASEAIAFHRESYSEVLQVLKELFAQEGKVTLATLRDALKTSRKFAQVLLEHFDREKITRREGDYRLPWKLDGGGRG